MTYSFPACAGLNHEKIDIPRMRGVEPSAGQENRCIPRIRGVDPADSRGSDLSRPYSLHTRGFVTKIL